MSRPLIAKESKAKGDKLMKNVRSSGGASRKTPVTAQYTTASGTGTTGSKTVDVPVDIDTDKVRQVLENLQQDQVPPQDDIPPVLPIQVSAEEGLPPANLQKSPPVLRRKSSKSANESVRTVDSAGRPRMSTGVSAVPTTQSSVGGLFEKAYILAQSLKPNLDHDSLLAFASKLVCTNSASSVSDSAPPSSTSSVPQAESVTDVRRELLVQPADSPSQRRRALLSEAQTATVTQAKRRRVDDRYGSNDDASRRTHPILVRTGSLVKPPRGSISPSPVSEELEISPTRTSSPHSLVANDDSEDDDVVWSQDTGAPQHRASAMTADESSLDSDDVDDAGKHRLRLADLTASVYRLLPDWEPDVSQADLPTTGAAQLFGDTQRWSPMNPHSTRRRRRCWQASAPPVGSDGINVPPVSRWGCGARRSTPVPADEEASYSINVVDGDVKLARRTQIAHYVPMSCESGPALLMPVFQRRTSVLTFLM